MPAPSRCRPAAPAPPHRPPHHRRRRTRPPSLVNHVLNPLSENHVSACQREGTSRELSTTSVGNSVLEVPRRPPHPSAAVRRHRPPLPRKPRIESSLGESCQRVSARRHLSRTGTTSVGNSVLEVPRRPPHRRRSSVVAVARPSPSVIQYASARRGSGISRELVPLRWAISP